MPSFELNKQIVQKAESYGLDFALSMIKLHGFGGETEFWDYALESFTPGRPVLEALLALSAQIHADFRFDPEATSVATPVAEVFAARRGVCQDFSHLMIACLRALGLAARYVSGYLLTEPPPGQPRLIGADASHAWVAVWCPGLGWIDVDPTNDLQPAAGHITLAWGRDYGDVCPLRGVILGGDSHTYSVGVTLVPPLPLVPGRSYRVTAAFVLLPVTLPQA